MKAAYLISIVLLLIMALIDQRHDIERAKFNLLWAICFAVLSLGV